MKNLCKIALKVSHPFLRFSYHIITLLEFQATKKKSAVKKTIESDNADEANANEADTNEDNADEDTVMSKNDE